MLRVTVTHGPPPSHPSTSSTSSSSSPRLALAISPESTFSDFVSSACARLDLPPHPDTRVYTPQGGLITALDLVQHDDVLFISQPNPPPQPQPQPQPPSQPQAQHSPHARKTLLSSLNSFRSQISSLLPHVPGSDGPESHLLMASLQSLQASLENSPPPPSSAALNNPTPSPSALRMGGGAASLRTPQIANRGVFVASTPPPSGKKGKGIQNSPNRRRRKKVRGRGGAQKGVMHHWTAHLVCDPFCEAALASAQHDRRGYYGAFLSDVGVDTIPSASALRIHFVHDTPTGMFIRNLIRDEQLPASHSSRSRSRSKSPTPSPPSSKGTGSPLRRRGITLSTTSPAGMLGDALNAARASSLGNSNPLSPTTPSSPNAILDRTTRRARANSVRSVVKKTKSSFVRLTGNHRGFIIYSGRVQTPEWEVWNAPIYFHGAFISVEHRVKVHHSLSLESDLDPAHLGGHKSKRPIRPSRLNALRPSIHSVANSSTVEDRDERGSDDQETALNLRPELLLSSRYGAHARTAAYAAKVARPIRISHPDHEYHGLADNVAPLHATRDTSNNAPSPTPAKDDSTVPVMKTIVKRRTLREGGSRDIVLPAAQAKDVTLTYEPSPHRVAQIKVKAGRKLVLRSATLRPVSYSFKDKTHTVATSVYVARDVPNLSGPHALGPHDPDSAWSLLLQHVWHDPDQERASRGIPIPPEKGLPRRKGRGRKGRRRKRKGGGGPGGKKKGHQGSVGAVPGAISRNADGSKTLAIHQTFPGPHTYTFYCCSGSLALNGSLVKLSKAEMHSLAIHDLEEQGMEHVLSLSHAVGEHLSRFGHTGSPLRANLLASMEASVNAKLGSPTPPSAKKKTSSSPRKRRRKRRLLLR